MEKYRKGEFTSNCVRYARNTLLTLIVVALVGLSSWTVILYSVHLGRLQERVEKLELQCRDKDANIEKLIDERIEKILKQVKYILSKNPKMLKMIKPFFR